MHRRNGLVLTVRAINPGEERAGALCQGFAGPFQPTAGVSAPLSLSFSRGDQCLTNNSTYFEITAGNTTLVKHGKQHWWMQPSRLSPSPFFGQAETWQWPMSMFYII